MCAGLGHSELIFSHGEAEISFGISSLKIYRTRREAKKWYFVRESQPKENLIDVRRVRKRD